MAEGMNSIRHDPRTGSLLLARNGEQERVILLRRGFWDGFFPEIVTLLGESGVSVVMRRLAQRVGLSDVRTERPTFRTLITCFDHRILPLSREESSLPEAVAWGPNPREVIVFGDTVWIIQDLFTIQQFKVVLHDILDENGANAVIRRVSRKGGVSVGDTALTNYRWADLDAAMASQNEQVFQYTFSVAGWSLARSAYRAGSDGHYMLLAKCANTFESEGIGSEKPVCKMLSSYLEGFFEGIASRLGGKSVECREVKCRATGDDYCAFAVKTKERNGRPLDWDALWYEWKDLDSEVIAPIAA
jgi:hypothetical protein